MKTTLGAAAFIAWAMLIGCSSSGSDGGSSGAGATSTAGAAGTQAAGGAGGALGAAGTSAAGTSAAGTSAAGTSAAGTNAAGGSGAASGAGGSSAVDEPKCSPGMTLQGIYAYPAPLHNCGFTGSGMLAGVQAYYRSIKLDTPLAPGGTYAFSVDMMTGDGKMELWGGSGECGDALELLATHNAGQGVRCMTASPKTGTYSYLIWVWYAAGTHGDVTFCPAGTCG